MTDFLVVFGLIAACTWLLAVVIVFTLALHYHFTDRRAPHRPLARSQPPVEDWQTDAFTGELDWPVNVIELPQRPLAKVHDLHGGAA